MLLEGVNVVLGQPGQNYQDLLGHGTFVAGLIGSRGILFPKLRGLAPGVRIRSYRIFGGANASNLDLVNAIALWRKRTGAISLI